MIQSQLTILNAHKWDYNKIHSSHQQQMECTWFFSWNLIHRKSFWFKYSYSIYPFVWFLPSRFFLTSNDHWPDVGNISKPIIFVFVCKREKETHFSLSLSHIRGRETERENCSFLPTYINTFNKLITYTHKYDSTFFLSLSHLPFHIICFLVVR